MARKIEEMTDTQEAASLYGECEAQETLLQKLALEVENCKEALKDAKEAYDGGVNHLRALARTRLDTPLFDSEKEKKNAND